MIRNYKAFGLALLAVFATSALGASAAQAGQFQAGAFPATITGQQIVPHEIGTEMGTMVCGVRYEGELAAASEQLTLTPFYESKCKIGGNETHVNTNGCDYRFNAGATLGVDEVEGSLDIICPEGNEIDFEVTGAMMNCHMTIGEQLGLGPITYTNKTMANDVEVDFAIEGLKYTLGNNCPESGTFETGSYTGTSTLRAHSGGAAVAFLVV